MLGTAFDFELRPATLDDAELVADLDARRDPDDVRDGVLIRHWWTVGDASEVCMRQIAVRDGRAVAFVAARHDPWETTDRRFGTVRAILEPEIWDGAAFRELVEVGEEWLRAEGVETSIARVAEHIENEFQVLDGMGYREVRRMRTSELDLNERREQILKTVMECRTQARKQGVELLTLDKDADPDKLRKLYGMVLEAEKDIPTTAPWRILDFEEWHRKWFENPGIREDRFWIARDGDRIVGMSALDFPVQRGFPYTALTATSRSVRGRGIARALKYESMNQAMELGFSRVRTMNDADNAPILHINKEMGYRLIWPLIELHRALGA